MGLIDLAVEWTLFDLLGRIDGFVFVFNIKDEGSETGLGHLRLGTGEYRWHNWDGIFPKFSENFPSDPVV